MKRVIRVRDWTRTHIVASWLWFCFCVTVLFDDFRFCVVTVFHWFKYNVVYGREWLLVGIIALAVGQVALYFYSASDGDLRVDRIVVFAIAAGSVMYCLGMVFGTTRWTAGNTGILFMFLATAIYWGYIWYYSIAAPTTPPSETVVDMARDLWIIGIPLAIIGWSDWAKKRWWDGRKRDDE